MEKEMNSQTVKTYLKALGDRLSSSRENGRPMRQVMTNLTGYAKPGELIGLLGPSCCGKSLWMQIISDRLIPPKNSIYERCVYVNKEEPLTRELFGKIAAYVMQDDVLLEMLTPYECLMFSAKLRLTCSDEEKRRRVEKVITDLGLIKCRDTLVKKSYLSFIIGW